MGNGIRLLEVGFEAALLWRTGEPKLECTQRHAQNRLAGLLLRRFQKDPLYEKAYRKAVDNYIREEYAIRCKVRVRPAELGRVDQYFLPHHGGMKKGDREGGRKLRLVFDAAATFNGKSLKDALLTGPAL